MDDRRPPESTEELSDVVPRSPLSRRAAARSTPCSGPPTPRPNYPGRPARAPTTSPPAASHGESSASTRCRWGRTRRGPSTHFHRTISESFFILSGEVDLFDGEQWITGRREDFLYVPVGGLHTFRNSSDAPASMLLLFSPGAPREEYFEQVAEMAQRGGPRPHRVPRPPRQLLRRGLRRTTWLRER